MTSWTLSIPRAIASQNRAPANRGSTAWRYRKERTLWYRDIAWSAKVAGVTPAQAKRTVRIVRLMGKGQRELDVANLWGGIKVLLDVMCRPRVFRGNARPGASLIVDDSPAWIDITVDQERAEDGVPGTRITIEEVEQTS